MLTAHRLSFPTCLFHPRSMYLLCHLDSSSIANLPCLGLQQQTGPEVSELCGSYRVPSRSSLLPLCTLSPGESRSQAKQPVLPIQPPLSPGESVAQTSQQAPRSPALRGHNNQQGKLTRLSYRLNNGRMAHGHDFGIETPRTGSISDRGYTRILQTNTGFSVQNMYEVFLQGLDPSYRSEAVCTQAVGWYGGEPPSCFIFAILFAWVGADTCCPGNCMRLPNTHHLPHG
jgi:hypothetical protein